MSRLKKVIIGFLVVLLMTGAGYGAVKGLKHARHLYYQMLGVIDYVSQQTSDLHTLTAREYNTLLKLQDEKKGLREFDYSWVSENPPFICHALGEYEGEEYTNSLEAFINSYKKGHTVFEADLLLTEKENAVILAHDEGWAEDGENSYEAFMKGDAPYTRMSLRDLMNIMKEYTEIILITDIKHTDPWEVKLIFTQLIYEATRVDAAILDRIVPQITGEQSFHDIMELYPFRSAIYTLYMTGNWTPESVVEFCEKTGIRFVTVPIWQQEQNPIETWNKAGLITAVHTINDSKQAENLFKKGYDMIYTDRLNPADYQTEER